MQRELTAGRMCDPDFERQYRKGSISYAGKAERIAAGQIEYERTSVTVSDSFLAFMQTGGTGGRKLYTFSAEAGEGDPIFLFQQNDCRTFQFPRQERKNFLYL